MNEMGGFRVIEAKSGWEEKCYILTAYGKALLDLIAPIQNQEK